MREEEKNDNDLDGRLKDYLCAEDQELDSIPGLWDNLSSRLGEQRRPGRKRRLLAVLRLGRPWDAASLSRPFGAPGIRDFTTISIALVVAAGLAYLGIILATNGNGGPMANWDLAIGPGESATPAPPNTVPTDQITPEPTAKPTSTSGPVATNERGGAGQARHRRER